MHQRVEPLLGGLQYNGGPTMTHAISGGPAVDIDASASQSGIDQRGLLRDDGALDAGAYEAGATDFITKPINYAMLGHRLHYMLRAKATLDHLRNSERRLTNAQRIARLGHWAWDSKSQRLEISPESYRIFGLNSTDLGASPESFLVWVHPDDREHVAMSFKRTLLEESSTSLEHRVRLNDGVERITAARR